LKASSVERAMVKKSKLSMNTIKKSLFIITLFFIGLTNSRAVGQVFILRSAGGNENSINVFLNDDRDILTISCSKDTFYIKDVTHIDTVKVLDESFLLVNYSVHAGSGLHLRHSLILSVKNNMICQSLHIISLFSEEFIDFSKPVQSSNPVSESRLFKVGFSLKRNVAQNYELIANVHDEKKSKHSPQTNYKHDNDLALKFDSSLNIFCSRYEDLSRYFTVIDPKTQEETKLYISGTFPMIQLGRALIFNTVYPSHLANFEYIKIS